MNLPPEVLEFIATQDPEQHPRARGCADPGHRVRQPEPAGRSTCTLTETVLKDLVGELDAPEITAATIMAVTAEYFAVSLDDLIGSLAQPGARAAPGRSPCTCAAS